MPTPLARVVRAHVARFYPAAVGRILSRLPARLVPDLDRPALTMWAALAAEYLIRHGRRRLYRMLRSTRRPFRRRQLELSARVWAGSDDMDLAGLIDGPEGLSPRAIPQNANLDVLAGRVLQALSAGTTEGVGLPVEMAEHVERWLEEDAQG
jgi:hypothetical protein